MTTKDTFHDEMLTAGIPLRFAFIYLRTRVVPFSEKPCGLPFCHVVAWQQLPHSPNRARVWYVRTDWPDDGHKMRLRHRRGASDEMIVCAKRLSALPPARYCHKPTGDVKRRAKTIIGDWNERWHLWAAEHQPIPTRLASWWERWFGKRKHARQIVLASETHTDRNNSVRWLGDFQSGEWRRLSYVKQLWHYPRIHNVIRSHDLWHDFGHKSLIIGFMEVDPFRQVELMKPCQRVFVLDYSDPDLCHDFGNHPLPSYKHCVIPESLFPGCEAESFDESRFKIRDSGGGIPQGKQQFLTSIGHWPTE